MHNDSKTAFAFSLWFIHVSGLFSLHFRGLNIKRIVFDKRGLPKTHKDSHRFFSSSSLLAFFLNLGSSCCSSSLAASRSLSAVLSLAKWNVVLSPVWRTSWSWILALPSGLIFWPAHIKKLKATPQHTRCFVCFLRSVWIITGTYSGYLNTGGWQWSGLCLLDPRLFFQPSGRECHPASSDGLSSPPTGPLLTEMP